MTRSAGILRAGHAVPLTKGGFGLLAPGEAPLAVDTSRMCATVVISHRSIDRTGDLVEPAGIDTANFARNPTVLLNHGKDYALPIGRAVDPAGRLTVKAEKDRVIATTYFAPTREGEQVFELVSQGFLNGASIGFNPLAEKPISRGGHHYLRWELLEYSHVTTPACPNAAEVLRRCLARGKVAGAPIAEPLRKSLECMAGPARAWANGATLNANEDLAMSKKWKSSPRKPATPAVTVAPAEVKAAPPPPRKPAAEQQPDPAAQEQAPPPAPAQTDLPTLLGQLTALIGQLTAVAGAGQQAAQQAAAGTPPEGAAEQAEDDADFGDESEAEADEDAASSGDGMSAEQEEDAEDEEETEELLQRYRSLSAAGARNPVPAPAAGGAGEPEVTKDMTEADGQAGGYLTDSLGGEHARAIHAVADHLDEMAGCEPGSTFTHSHKAAFSHHAKCMRGVCRALDEGDGAGDEGDTPGASGEPTEKAADLDATSILDALKPLAARVTGHDDLLYSITGKKAS